MPIYEINPGAEKKHHIERYLPHGETEGYVNLKPLRFPECFVKRHLKFQSQVNQSRRLRNLRTYYQEDGIIR